MDRPSVEEFEPGRANLCKDAVVSIHPIHKAGVTRPLAADVNERVWFLYNNQSETIASSTSPRALSNWAFRNGAKSVSHNYDLRLSPDK